MDKLSSVRWESFVISDIFTISPGKRLTKADMKVGKRPFIGATDSNNGITAWVDNTNESLDKLVLGVNYNGSVVETFFHPYECIFSDDVKRLHLKNGITSYHVMLFLKTMIIQQKVKFEYGYKFNEKRMQRQKILLPITEDNSPDWQFMEEYMRRKETLLLKPAVEKLCKRLIHKEILGGVNYSALNGNILALQKYSQKYSVVSVLKKQTTQKALFHTYHPQHSTMGWMDSSATKAA